MSGWALAAHHFFYADDWGWLERVAFDIDTFRLVPEKVYNDRPAGEFFIKWMYEWFGLNAHPYNVLWLLLHIFNSILLFFLAANYLPRNRALLAAVLAASWYSTLIAVHWVAAIFDLAGATWCLLCLLFYVHSSRESCWSPLWLVGAFCLHVLAIRTKEFALALVVVLASWEFLLIESKDLRRRLSRLAPHVLLTLVYGLIYLRLFSLQKPFVSSGIYSMSLSLSTILENAISYLSMAFYMPAPDKDFAWRLAAYALLVAMLLLGCSSRKTLAAMVSAVALLAAVLLMPNQQSALYLYVPHFFVAFVLCAVAPRCRVATVITWLTVGLIIGWPFFTGGWKASRNFYLTTGEYSERLHNDYVRLMQGRPPPVPLTIAVSKTYFDPFSWGHGSFLRIRYGNPDITANVVSLSGPDDDVCAHVSGTCLIEQSGHLVLRQGSAPSGTTQPIPSPLVPKLSARRLVR
ncbi:hypothetical protein [Rhodanobacter sp. C03]|uniref:hypothetical protein n=1 Tax=Rhodanobacter sp. C03 TaxID=1945858 RepID=UPI0009CA1783|nr:hypothetical protein [Rhodanobacter sp. C03]OOG55540.1 hypothetical protein B0E48_12930 [Rhodanobacter sp. C03]